MLYQITQKWEEISPVSVPHQIHQSIDLRENIFFNGPTIPFSNFYPCKLQYHNNSFNSTEQICQWIKAIVVGDQFIAQRILEHEDPYAIKKCSNNLLPQAVEHWRHRRGVYLMMELLDLKYDQVEEFCNTCKHSQDALPFGTITDIFWGVGYQQDAKQKHLNSYRGQNILGWMIMLIHDRKLGKDTSWKRNLYHQYPQIQAFQGIEHILQFI